MARNGSHAQEVNPLPPGWRALISDDGRVYYQNDVTKRTQWQPPSYEQHQVQPPQTICVVVPNTQLQSTPETKPKPKPKPNKNKKKNKTIGCLATLIAVISLGTSLCFTALNVDNVGLIASTTIILGFIELGLSILKFRLDTRAIRGKQQDAKAARDKSNRDCQKYKNTSTVANMITLGNLKRKRKLTAEQSAAEARVRNYSADHVESERLDLTFVMAAVTDSLFDIVNGAIILVFRDDVGVQSGWQWLAIGAWFGFGEAVADVLMFVVGMAMEEAAKHIRVLGVVVLMMTTVEIMIAMVWTFGIIFDFAVVVLVVLVVLLYAALGIVNCKSGVIKAFRRNAAGNASCNSCWLYCGCFVWVVVVLVVRFALSLFADDTDA